MLCNCDGGLFIVGSQAVSDDKDKLNAALALINRLFGEDGEKLMTLAPDAFLVTEDGEPVTAGYKDTQIPLFGSETLADISVLAGGDAVEYARKYLGSCTFNRKPYGVFAGIKHAVFARAVILKLEKNVAIFKLVNVFRFTSVKFFHL